MKPPPRRTGGVGGGQHQILGLLGETVAAEALVRAGYVVIERRRRSRGGEIDLIAECGDLLVFVEVKTRSGAVCGEPAEAVTWRKQRRLARLALEYLARRRWLDRPCRFDVVEVWTRGDSVERLRHRVDAFRIWPTG